jgi:MFS family permease
MDARRWRIAAVLGGVGSSLAVLLPLFVLIALDGSVQVAAFAAAAYTLGALSANLALWGRLADRLRNPRRLVIAGVTLQSASLFVLALFPREWEVIGFAVMLGAVSVAAEAAFMRLVVGDLTDRARNEATITYTRLVQLGSMFGFGLAAVGVRVLQEFVDPGVALRLAVATMAVAILAELAIVLSTLRRRAPAVSEGGAPQAVDAASNYTQTWDAGRLREGADAGLSDSLRLLLVSLFVLHVGFALHSGVFPQYLSREAELGAAEAMTVLLGGSVMTTLTIVRIGSWLRTIPAVRIQTAAGAARTVLFATFAALAVFPGANASVAAVAALYLVNQVVWGAVVPAHTQRITELAPPERRGEVLALYGAAVGGGATAGTVLAGVTAAAIGFPFTFAAAAVITAIATVALLRW